MFRKYLLTTFSIVHMICVKEKLPTTAPIFYISEILQASFGGIVPFISGGQSSTIIFNQGLETLETEWVPTIIASIISSSATTYLFVFCPISIIGIPTAFGFTLMTGFIIEYGIRCITGKNKDFDSFLESFMKDINPDPQSCIGSCCTAIIVVFLFPMICVAYIISDFLDVFIRQIPKSIGAGTYIALSYFGMPLVLIPIFAALALIIPTNYFFDTQNTMLHPKYTLASLLYALSMWLACGYSGNLSILGLVIAAFFSIYICIDSKARKWHWGGLVFGLAVLLGLHIFGVMAPALTICTIILLQVTSFFTAVDAKLNLTLEQRFQNLAAIL